VLTRSARLPRRRSSHQYSAGSNGSASSNHRLWGQTKFIYEGRRITAALFLVRTRGIGSKAIERRFWRNPVALSFAGRVFRGAADGWPSNRASPERRMSVPVASSTVGPARVAGLSTRPLGFRLDRRTFRSRD
jgi:hypothetical protein